MCVMSMVMDHYEDKFPYQAVTTIPTVNQPTFMWDTTWIVDMRKLIAEFRELVESAKKIDLITGQPDCVDPNKEKLIARVAELERQLASGIVKDNTGAVYRVFEGKLYKAQ